MRIWDTTTGRLSKTITSSQVRRIEHLAVADTGEWLVVGDHGGFQLWTPGGECLAAMRVEPDIHDCVPPPGGTAVAIGSSHGLSIFDLR